MRIETHRLTIPARDGCEAHTLFYRDYGSIDARRTAVCVHGLARNGDDFEALAIALAQKDTRVIVPDMAGRGDSDWLRDPMSYHYGNYVADCITLLDNFHLRNVHWIGTSMGGLIGMMIAATTQGRIRSLVLNDIGSFLPKESLARIYAYLAALPHSFANYDEADTYISANYEGFGITKPSQWRAFVQRSIEPVGDEGALRLRFDPAVIEPLKRDSNNFTEVHDVNLAELWMKVKLPTLIIRGERSDLLMPFTVDAMKSVNIRAQSVVYAGAGHAPALLDDVQISPILRFLDEQIANRMIVGI